MLEPYGPAEELGFLPCDRSYFRRHKSCHVLDGHSAAVLTIDYKFTSKKESKDHQNLKKKKNQG